MIPLTNHNGLAGEHIADALKGFFCITFLNMADQRIDDRHAQNHQCIDPMAHDGSQHCRRQQDINQYIVEMG
ncbi:hypothetical protein D3C76_1075580 [compost metagenome]